MTVDETSDPAVSFPPAPFDGPFAPAWLLAARPQAAEPALAAAAAAEGGARRGPGLVAFPSAAAALRGALRLREAMPTAALCVAFGGRTAPDLGAAPGALRCTASAFAESRRWLPALSARHAGVRRAAGEAGGEEILEIPADSRGASDAAALRPARPAAPPDAALIAPLPSGADADDAAGLAAAVAARLARWRGATTLAPAAGAMLAAEAGDAVAAARAFGARWAVTVALRRDGAGAAAEVRATEAATGADLWSGWRRWDDAAPGAADELADAVAAALGLALSRAPASDPGDARAVALTRAALPGLDRGRDEWREARRLLDGACALDPGCAPARAARSRATLAAWRHGWDPAARPEAARADAEAAAAADPLDAEAWTALSAAALAGGSVGAARGAAAGAVRLNPTDPFARAALAAALSRAGDPAAALAELERAMALHPCFPDAWLAVEAAARLTAGDAAGAAEAALRMRAPEAGRAALAGALLALGDVAAAREAAAAARAERPELKAADWLDRLALGSHAAEAAVRRALAGA
jgi:tetratricopeptide (TPR) repeat protein